MKIKFKKDYVFHYAGKNYDVVKDHEMDMKDESIACLLCKRDICCEVKPTKAKVKK